MSAPRAVLFDFGGTLYDYACLEVAERESLVELARWTGSAAEPAAIVSAHRDGMRDAFRSYLPRAYYLHRDLFRDAVVGMLARLGVTASDDILDRYRQAQWARHQRDFQLRAGVIDTLVALRARGVHLGIVSNIDDDQLEHLLGVAEIAPYFDSILSSEQVQSCKPDRMIFHAAVQRAGCAAPEALFVGDTLAADVAGANAAGLKSVLLWHRDDRKPPETGPQPRHVIRQIPDLLALV